MSTALFHVRRAAAEAHRTGDSSTLLVGKLRAQDYVAVKEILKMVRLRDIVASVASTLAYEDDEEPLKKGVKGTVVLDEAEERLSEEASGIVVLDDAGEPLKKGARGLAVKVSDASVDSEGMPRMLSSPKPSKEGSASSRREDAKPPASSNSHVKATMHRSTSLRRRIMQKSPPQDEGSEDLRLLLGYGEQIKRRPCLQAAMAHTAAGSSCKRDASPAQKRQRVSDSSKSPAKSPKGKSKVKASSPKKESTPAKAKRTPWHKLRKTKANNPGRPYICGALEKGGKLTLICEVPRKWHPHYDEIADMILEELKENHLTKQEALALRHKLCSSPWL